MGQFQSQILGATQNVAHAALGMGLLGGEFEKGVKESVKEFQDYTGERTTDVQKQDFNTYVKGSDVSLKDEDIAEELEEDIPEGGYTQADYIRAYAKTIGEAQMRDLQEFGQRIISNYHQLNIGIKRKKGGKK